MIAKCTREWTGQPRNKVGEECEIVRWYFYNGEGHLTLRGTNGEQFDSPDVFWNFDEDAAEELTR